MDDFHYLNVLRGQERRWPDRVDDLFDEIGYIRQIDKTELYDYLMRLVKKVTKSE